MFIPDPDFYPSRIPDPKTATKERGEKKEKKKILANFQRIIELFTQKIVNKLLKYGFGIRDPDPGVKKAPDPGSVSPTLEHSMSSSLTLQ
jgi:hypothetical protein